MAEQNRQPYISYQSNYTWQNKHLNVKGTVERLYDAWDLWRGETARPASRVWEPGLSALQAIVRTAEADQKQVRGLGGAWSLSEAALTEHYLVNTGSMNSCLLGVPRDLLAAACTVVPDNLVFAQSGIHINELNTVLEANGRSLKTSGASNGQTLAGAVSTGTHGSANQVGSMQECIHGLHIVAEQGNHFWIQRKSRPAVTTDFTAILGATLLEDDELFNAAVVSFGSFGLIHALLLEVEPIYTLDVYGKFYNYPDVTNAIGTLDVSSLHLDGGDSPPFHFEVDINPYKAGANDLGAYVKYMYHRPGPPPQSVASPSSIVTKRLSADIVTAVGTLSDDLPDVLDKALTKQLVGTAMDSALKPITKVSGTHGEVFGGTDLRGRVLSCELGVPLDKTPDAVEIILNLAQKSFFAGLVSLRFVKNSLATLAFTRHTPYTCTIELPGSFSQRTVDFYAAVWGALRAKGIPPTYHWGQLLPHDPAAMRDAYGSSIDSWLAARKRFLPGSGRQTFSNNLLKDCGLAG